MRVGIITFLHNDNYGSTLQAWALQQALISLGVEAEHLDYCPDQMEKLRNLLHSGNSPELLLEGIAKRSVKAGQEGAQRKSEAFRRFRREQLILSAPCRDSAALAKAAAGADVLISGSDQIWSPVWLNPVYYLNFAENQRRIAYAPSFGVREISSARKRRMIAEMIRRYDAVSVREGEGAEIVRALTGENPPVMPDPVCLITREKWLELAVQPEIKKPYLACYFIGDQPAYWDRAREMAQSLGLEIRVIPVTQNAYDQQLPLAAGLSPQEWVGTLAGAAHVLTDSFHGTVFSALLGREFTVLRRYREDDPESKNSRIDNLFRELGLDGTEQQIPWPQVEERLLAMRKRGLDWLRQVLVKQK